MAVVELAEWKTMLALSITTIHCVMRLTTSFDGCVDHMSIDSSRGLSRGIQKIWSVQW